MEQILLSQNSAALGIKVMKRSQTEKKKEEKAFQKVGFLEGSITGFKPCLGLTAPSGDRELNWVCLFPDYGEGMRILMQDGAWEPFLVKDARKQLSIHRLHKEDQGGTCTMQGQRLTPAHSAWKGLPEKVCRYRKEGPRQAGI